MEVTLWFRYIQQEAFILFTIRTTNTHNTLEYNKRKKNTVTLPTMTCKKKVALNPTKHIEKTALGYKLLVN